MKRDVMTEKDDAVSESMTHGINDVNERRTSTPSDRLSELVATSRRELLQRRRPTASPRPGGTFLLDCLRDLRESMCDGWRDIGILWRRSGRGGAAVDDDISVALTMTAAAVLLALIASVIVWWLAPPSLVPVVALGLTCLSWWRYSRQGRKSFRS